MEKLAAPAEALARNDGPPELQRANAHFHGLMEMLTEELGAIEGTGVTVKDLDLGLCDFLGMHKGRKVWLCWQFGEKRIAFWHELGAGFAARRPLEKKADLQRIVH
jgi:hypothetical protein